MEPAWEKVCEGKFSLTLRTIVQPNGRTCEVSCYLLTKTGRLYIATNARHVQSWYRDWEGLKMAEVRCKQPYFLPFKML